MISATVNQRQINDITKFLNGNAKAIRQQLYIATNKAAGKTKAMIAKEVSTTLNAPQKIIKKSVNLLKAKPGAYGIAKVTQKAYGGLPVKYLKPKQTAAGVTYKPYKGAGPVTIQSAFIVASLGNHVFKRVGVKRPSKRGRYTGQMRQKIQKQFGPSTIFVFEQRGVEAKAVTFATTQLQKEVTERARFLGLKKSGAI